MKELTSAKWIKLKGVLFLVIGLVAALLLLIERPTWKMGALLLVTVWCFCRFYYFAFYVIERYVDSRYKFSGLGSFLLWFFRSR